MKPKSTVYNPQMEMFRVELTSLVDLSHPLVKLGGTINWAGFEELRWTPKVGKVGSLTQSQRNDPHVQETTPA